MNPAKLQTMETLFHRAYGNALQPACAKYDLSRMELEVLLFLANNPHLDTARQLVRTRKIAKSYVSAAVTRLLQLELISTSLRHGNRKTIHLTPTEQGEAVVSFCRELEAEFTARLFSGISEEEQDSFSHVCGRLTVTLQALLNEQEAVTRETE